MNHMLTWLGSLLLAEDAEQVLLHVCPLPMTL